MADPVLAQLVRTRRFTVGVPHQFTIVAGGSAVLYRRSRSADDPTTVLCRLDLESTDLHSTVESTLVDAGVDAYATDAAGALVAFTRDSALWTVLDGQTRRLPTAGPVTDRQPDPTGHRIAYRSGGGGLHLIEADGTGDRALVEPDDPEVTFGDGPGYWWAPDGRRLLTARVDLTLVPRWPLPDPTRTVRFTAPGHHLGV